jgi:hypothetical protein
MLSTLSLNKIDEDRTVHSSSSSSSSGDFDDEEVSLADHHDTVDVLHSDDEASEVDSPRIGNNTDPRHHNRSGSVDSKDSTGSSGVSWTDVSLGSFGDLSFLQDELDDDDDDDDNSIELYDLDVDPRERSGGKRRPTSSAGSASSLSMSRRQIMDLLTRENSIRRMSRSTGGRRIVGTFPKEERDRLMNQNSMSSINSDDMEPNQVVGRVA